MELAVSTSEFQFETVHLNASGDEIERQQRSAYCFNEILPGGVALEMVNLPEGTAYLGSPNTEYGRSPNECEPYLSAFKAFFIGKFPVTQAQWDAVASLPKVKHSISPDIAMFPEANRPVEQVTWFEAVEFCARLSTLTGKVYRLPTAAEWEYACRAGMQTPFYFGQTLRTDLANYWGEDKYDEGRRQRYQPQRRYRGRYGQGPSGQIRGTTTEIGYFNVANAFGLYDMHGNVWEWCGSNSSDGSTDRLAKASNQSLLKGGSWKSPPAACRSAFGLVCSSGHRSETFGFRVVYSTHERSSDTLAINPAILQQVFSHVNANEINVETINQTINISPEYFER